MTNTESGLSPIPTTTAHTTPLPLWGVSAYDFIGSVLHQEELRARAIAPIVAAARGIEYLDRDSAGERASAYGYGAKNEKYPRQMRDLAGDLGMLMLPWYSPQSFYGVKRPVVWRQFRPANPREANGKVVKYDAKSNSTAPVDLHPATPPDYFRKIPGAVVPDAPVIVAEGMFKSDAMLTAFLRTNGISDADLAYTGDPALDADARLEQTRDALHTMMTKVPAKDRALIVSVSSVTTWNKPRDWADIALADRRALVAFDADFQENPQVWSQAKQLMEYLETRGADVEFIALADVDPANPLPPGPPGVQIEKMGVDDYLAEAGTWDDLMQRTTTDLGEMPVPKRPLQVGDWRMNDTTRMAEQLTNVVDENGEHMSAWVGRSPFVGRILRSHETRSISEAEEATGILDKTPQTVESEVVIEVSWVDEQREQACTGEIIGPLAIVGETPREWNRRGDAVQVPAMLSLAPGWPIKDDGWMDGVKRHRADEAVHVLQWAENGWVPTDDGLPVFLTPDGAVDHTGMTGRAEHRRTGSASDYIGVIVEDDREEQIKAIRDVWHAYAGDPAEPDRYVRNAWSDRAIGAIVLAAALRPLVPIAPQSSILFAGQSHSGKSWTAATIMQFWQTRPGQWHSDRMPGSAKDTPTAIEIAMNQNPIWVIDDIAPSSSRNEAENDMMKLENVLRAAFNRTAKNRATAKVEARRQRLPRALLVATAENETDVRSVRNRTVLVEVGRGFIDDDDLKNRIDVLGEEGVQAKVTYAAAKVMARPHDRDGSWSAYVAAWKQIRDQLAAHAAVVFGGGEAKRMIALAADLQMGLRVWERLFVEYGFTVPYMRQVNWLIGNINEFVKELAVADTDHSVGNRTIQALGAVLANGKAYVGGSAIRPPSDDPMVNSALGWALEKDGAWSHRGERIGDVVMNDDGELVVLFHPTNAFKAAQRNAPELLLPGQKAKTSWRALWDEGLTDTHWAQQKDRVRNNRPTVRVTVDGSVMIGVPVTVATLRDVQVENDPRARVIDPAVLQGDGDLDVVDASTSTDDA